MRILLTANFIKTATAEPGKERSVFWDATMPGFGLVVTSTGAKAYCVQYRANGVSRRLTLDGQLALNVARREAKKRLGEVAKGFDPLAERRRQVAASKVAASGTLEFIAREYFKREGRKIRTMAEREAAFERLILPMLGKCQIEDISRRDIVRLLDKVEDERGPRMADATLAYLSRLFNWHAARTDDFRNPVVRGMRRIPNPAERARTRVLTDDELRAVWATAEKPGPFSALVRFILLTAARRNEAARMTWSEVDKHGDWVISAERYKTKTELVLPLSRAAQSLLAEVPRLGKFVFSHNGNRSITGFSKPKRDFDAACGVKGWVLHDLRRTARSLMSRAGVSADHAERCLGHVISGVRGVYDRHAFHSEKKFAFEALAAQIERIVAGPQDNVTQMRRGR
jgi:integrase